VRRGRAAVQFEHHVGRLHRGVRLLVELVVQLQRYPKGLRRAVDTIGLSGEDGRGLHLERDSAHCVHRHGNPLRHDHLSSRVRGDAGLHLEVIDS
jgi:hypothetical protein